MLLSTKIQHNLSIPIESYSSKLTWYMQEYLNMVDIRLSDISPKANEKAKIALRWIIFPNNKEFEKDFNSIEHKIGDKTVQSIRMYTKCLMLLLGTVAECVIVDRCSCDSSVNRICINIAQYCGNIYEDYPDIHYEDYIAFSTSFKYMIYKNTISGQYEKYPVSDYNPKHTSKDIGWCKRDNHLTQLKVDKQELGYVDNAKLQVKATINSSNINADEYFPTPVICFDLCNDFHKISNELSYNIVSAHRICPEMELELEQYFRILGAYATGMINSIDISTLTVNEDVVLAELFRTPIVNIVQQQQLDFSGLTSIVEAKQKPVVIGV